MNFIVLFSIGLLSNVVYTQDVVPTDGEELDDDAFIKNFDEAGYDVACEWMGITDPTMLKLNLSREMSYKDATKLIFLNKGSRMQGTLLEFPEDIKWKRDLINQIWSLYKTLCPSVFVNHDYMNIMRELAMVYLNSVQPRTSPDPEVWAVIMESLVKCNGENLPPYNFTSAGLMVYNIYYDSRFAYCAIDKLIPTDTDSLSEDINDNPELENPDDDGDNGDENANLVDLHLQIKNAQLVYHLDIIIDNLWQVFSHAFARCLRTAPSRELWGPRFKQLFFRDILEPLEERWANPGEKMKSFLRLIMGDYDVSINQANIPYCTQAAYLNSSGTLLVSQLVRPIKLTKIEKGVRKFQNTRV